MRANERPNALRPTRLGCEQLEHRDNPAGNMAAFFSADGVLNVFGDGLDNAVSIQQNGFGDTIIFGVNGTLINGLSAIFVGRGTLAGVNVDGGFGNDLLEVLGVQTPGNIVVQGGVGNDGIHVNGVLATAVGISGWVGNDVITTANIFVASFAVVDGGFGFDVIANRGIFGPQSFSNFEQVA
jgi:hypothetical protein